MPDMSEQLRSKSLVQQIECPISPALSYSTEFGTMDGSSLKYVFGTAIPQALGYINYNFTALGSNDASSFGAKAGLTSSYADSKRVLGYNYFYPTGITCNALSEPACKGAKQYFYIRNYPVGLGKLVAKGNLTFGIINDIIDLNPLPIIRSMLLPGANATCKMATYPVGSALDDPDVAYANAEEFEATLEPACTRPNNVCCIDKCKPMHEIEAANCEKACFRAHWTESRCVSELMATPQTVAAFGGSGGSGGAGADALLVALILVLVALLLWGR